MALEREILQLYYSDITVKMQIHILLLCLGFAALYYLASHTRIPAVSPTWQTTGMVSDSLTVTESDRLPEAHCQVHQIHRRNPLVSS